MLNNSKAIFSSFSTDDLTKAKKFYIDKLGLVLDNEDMGLAIKLPAGTQLFIYEKEDHQPATFTVLNFVVENIDEEVKELKAKGIKFEEISFGENAKTDEKGIMRGRSANQGPDIAWFKDPAGNFLSIIEE
ncbi:MAG TPA: VOC family protein [Candidatus Saccharimonadales bacterium]|nr:VOC family protein [Candidatus Saccharimonadales bacterium]